VAPSRRRLGKALVKKAKDKREALRKEIKEDIKDHKTLAVTTDGGTSHEKMDFYLFIESLFFRLK
jgi:molybdopterin biosynthesis enzyme MoaB